MVQQLHGNYANTLPRLCHCVYPILKKIGEILFWVIPLHHSWFAISCELNWMEDLVQLSQSSDAVHKQTLGSKKTTHPRERI